LDLTLVFWLTRQLAKENQLLMAAGRLSWLSLGGSECSKVTDCGSYWHHSKQASSILHQAMNDKTNAKTLAIRAEILQLTTPLRSSSDDYGVRPSEIKKRLASLEKE
jgi:hypothetical protein